jgi:hypothetical protein
MTQTSFFIVSTQDVTAPVTVHLDTKQGRMVSLKLEVPGATIMEWPKGKVHMNNITITPSSITLPSLTTVTIGFESAKHNHSKTPFRFIS